MLDIAQELQNLIKAFEAKELAYALCGGLALAVHDESRTPYGLDFLLAESSVAGGLSSAESVGFRRVSEWTQYEDDAFSVQFLFKIDEEDGALLQLNLIAANNLLSPCLETRERRAWSGVFFWTLSPQGLEGLASALGKPCDTLLPPWKIRKCPPDMSPVAIGCRLQRVSQLCSLCFSLARSLPMDKSVRQSL